MKEETVKKLGKLTNFKNILLIIMLLSTLLITELIATSVVTPFGHIVSTSGYAGILICLFVLLIGISFFYAELRILEKTREAENKS